MKKSANVLSIVAWVFAIVAVALLALTPTICNALTTSEEAASSFFGYFSGEAGEDGFSVFFAGIQEILNSDNLPGLWGGAAADATIHMGTCPAGYLVRACVIIIALLFLAILIAQIVRKRHRIWVTLSLIVVGLICLFFSVLAFWPVWEAGEGLWYRTVSGAISGSVQNYFGTEEVSFVSIALTVIMYLPYLFAAVAFILVVVSGIAGIASCTKKQIAKEDANKAKKEEEKPAWSIDGKQNAPFIVQYINSTPCGPTPPPGKGPMTEDDIRRIIREETGLTRTAAPAAEMMTEDDLRAIVAEAVKENKEPAPAPTPVVTEVHPVEERMEPLTEDDLRRIVREEVIAVDDSKAAKEAAKEAEEEALTESRLRTIVSEEMSKFDDSAETEMMTEEDLRRIVREEVIAVDDSKAAKEAAEAKEEEEPETLTEERLREIVSEEIAKLEEKAQEEEPDTEMMTEEDLRSLIREEVVASVPPAKAENATEAPAEVLTEDDLKRLISEELAAHDKDVPAAAPERLDEDSYLTSEDLRQIVREELSSAAPKGEEIEAADLTDTLGKVVSEEISKLDIAETIRTIVREELDKKLAEVPPAPVEEEKAEEAPAEKAPQTIIINLGETPAAKEEIKVADDEEPIIIVPVKEPEPEPEPEPQPEPEPEPAPEPEPEPEPAPEPEPEPAPQPAVQPLFPEPFEKGKTKRVVGMVNPNLAPHDKIIRIPFPTRMLGADKELQKNYNELKAECLSYGLKSRVSNSGDTFRLHTKTYVKITIAGKGLKLYFALNPQDYANSPIPVYDASEKNIYKDIPTVLKVRSELSVRRAKQLIADVCERDNLEQGKIPDENFVKDLLDYKPQNSKEED